jgi:hypothetical protein
MNCARKSKFAKIWWANFSQIATFAESLEKNFENCKFKDLQFAEHMC